MRFGFTDRGFKEHADIFSWISEIATHDDIILLIDASGAERVYRYVFPLSAATPPERIGGTTELSRTTFIIAEHSALKKRELSDGDWCAVFSSSRRVVWERRSRHAIVPLRFGLSDEERTQLFSIVRESVSFRLKGEPFIPGSFTKRFHEFTEVGVAYWLDGHPHGSTVAKGLLHEAVVSAAFQAATDPRFKALTAQEFERVRIEITVIPGPFLGLSKKEISLDRVQSELAYRFAFEGHRGWFLPEAHNFPAFGENKSLQSFIRSLAVSKAGMKAVPRNLLSHVAISNVDDFIEHSPRAHTPVVLRGSMPRQHAMRWDAVKSSAQATFEWLLSLENEDGSLRPIVSPSPKGRFVIDHPRLAFTGLSLAEYAAVDPRAADSARRILGYFEANHLSGNAGIPRWITTYAYLGRLALALSRRDVAVTIFARIRDNFSLVSSEHPIAVAQVAGFLSSLGGEGEQMAQSLTLLLRARFQAERASGVADIASYAELLPLFIPHDRAFAEDVRSWMLGFQDPLGHFPSDAKGGIPMTRGTGKVFEALCADSRGCEAEIRSVVEWFISMQYTDVSSFFIPLSMQAPLRGGFRHDAFNHEAWIDASAHFLYGVARLSRSGEGEKIFP